MKYIFIYIHDIYGDHRDRRGYDPQVGSQLFIFQHALPVLKQKEEVQIKVYPEQDHKHCDHAVDICAVVKSNAGVPVGKSSCARSAEGVDDRVIQIHAAKHQQDDLNRRQHKIHLIEELCRASRLWHKLIRLRSRNFCTHKRHGVFVVQRCDHHNKYKHAHASDPVGKTPPEINAHGQGLDFLKDCRSGRRKPGHGLKKRIHIIRDRP